MARAARKSNDDDTGEVKTKDPSLAKKLYFHDIKPARSKASEHMQEVSTAKKAVKKQANFQGWSFDAAVRAHEMEDARKEDAIRGFVAMFNELEGHEVLTCNYKDMVDMMETDDGYARPPLSLVTLSDGSETDLGYAGEEVAQQSPDGASED
jgi:hypothetical protein